MGVGMKAALLAMVFMVACVDEDVDINVEYSCYSELFLGEQRVQWHFRGPSHGDPCEAEALWDEARQAELDARGLRAEDGWHWEGGCGCSSR